MTNEDTNFSIKARIVIYGFECAYQEITDIMGVNPTKAWMRGDKVHPKSNNLHKQNGWSISSQLEEKNSSVDDQIDNLKNLVLPYIKEFKSLPKGSEVQLSCIVYAYKYWPPLSFSSNSVAFLSEIGASIDLDIYDQIEEE